MLSTYHTFIDTDNINCQVVLNLPQSKIGYTYPELWFCIPKKGRLHYIKVDLTIYRGFDMGEKEFLQSYTNSPELTDEVMKEIGFTEGMGCLADIASELKKRLRD